MAALYLCNIKRKQIINVKKQIIMNATIIISAVLVMLSVTGLATTTEETQYAHCTETTSDRVTTQTVYKVEADKYLHCHVKNKFSYNAQNQLQQKEVLKWNSAISGWEKSYCINFSYDQSETTATYARWDTKNKAYSEVLEKATYNQDKETHLLASYQSFKWNKQSQQWDVVIEHDTIGWSDALYAISK